MTDSKFKRLKHQRYVSRKREKAAKNKKKIGKNTNRFNNDRFKVLKVLNEKHFMLDGINIPSVITINMPEVFCFCRNPDESIYLLRRLYTYMINPNVKKIHFNHFSCNYISVCASTVMDVIVMECFNYRKRKKQPLELSGTVQNGRVSASDEVDQLVKMSGLLNHLHITKEYALPNTEKLPMLRNGDSSDVAKKTIDYLDRALTRHGYKLTKIGKNYFGRLLGEIVDNCQNHAGEHATWYTLGHYNYDIENNIGKCRLTICDFGNTIYESLKYHSTQRILKKVNHYTKKSWISFRSVRNEETLFTLFSLQQRVSRFISKDHTRGNGTVQFIDATLKLFSPQSEMSEQKSLFSITSGKCSILFDGKYQLQDKTYKKEYTNKIIAFNEKNDLTIEPDKNYVRTLDNSFPGTIISMDLTISNQYIERINSV